jgi:hypothetical protein
MSCEQEVVMKLRVGDWVEVRSKEEILKTLDKRGRMEGLPFMPQMFEYCGQRFRVFKRAHKTCDFVYGTGGRRLPNGIHLETRCDGKAYGGCQNACLHFWKEAWLKQVDEHGRSLEGSPPRKSLGNQEKANEASCTVEEVWGGTHPEDGQGADELRYSCQMTQVLDFTTLLPWWDIRQYLEDYTSGNVTLGRMLVVFSYFAYYKLSQTGIGLGRPLRWFYERLYGVPWPRAKGTIPAGQPTPASTLDLQPGELVRIKPHKEILATLNSENRNRGLFFDAEMAAYCGGTYRVRERLKNFLDEKTGELIALKNEAIVLENVCCGSRYSDCRLFCPRALYSWWREIWLERVPEDTQKSTK